MVVTDAFADAWKVGETRDTPHGFAVYLGRPAIRPGRRGRMAIITAELWGQLNARRYRPAALSLPIGATAIKRTRGVIGHHWRHDREPWWLERLGDLVRLTGREFARRHEVSKCAVSEARKRYLVQLRLNPRHWWREQETAQLLLSDAPVSDVAATFGLSSVTIRGYRARLRGETEA